MSFGRMATSSGVRRAIFSWQPPTPAPARNAASCARSLSQRKLKSSRESPPRKSPALERCDCRGRSRSRNGSPDRRANAECRSARDSRGARRARCARRRSFAQPARFVSVAPCARQCRHRGALNPRCGWSAPARSRCPDALRGKRRGSAAAPRSRRRRLRLRAPHRGRRPLRLRPRGQGPQRPPPSPRHAAPTPTPPASASAPAASA